MELAGQVPETFREAMAQARITLVVDGERVLDGFPVRDHIGPLAGPPPEKTPFSFRSAHQSCLFTAHKMGGTGAYEPVPVGYFLPRGSRIDARLVGVPLIPPGVTVRIGGAGFHYSPDTEACKAGSACGTK